MTVRGIGSDLTSIADVGRSIDEFGFRYLDRMFTPAEQDDCRLCTGGAPRSPGARTARFAGLFAAKEATLKALGPIGARPEWRHIEVRPTAGGRFAVRLVESARTLADEGGVDHIELALATHGPFALAVATAISTTSATARSSTAPNDTVRCSVSTCSTSSSRAVEPLVTRGARNERTHPTGPRGPGPTAEGRRQRE